MLIILKFFYYKRNRFFFLCYFLNLTSYQSATWTPFRAPIPTILHLHSLDFNAEQSGKMIQNFKKPATYFLLFRKKVVLSV